MKTTRLFIIAILVSLCVPQAKAQEYIPFVREGVKWVCQRKAYTTFEEFTLEFKGDAEFNGKTYKAMHKYSGESIDWDNDEIPVYMREENRVVYAIVPDGMIAPDCPVGIETDTLMSEKIANGEEFILYDFNDPSEALKNSRLLFTFPRLICDMVPVGGNLSKRYIQAGSTCLVEGIGYDSSLGKALPTGITLVSPRISCLSHVIENGEVIYESEVHKADLLTDDYLPIVREGVQWVNERVVIENGVEKRNYYVYEFRGKDNVNRPVCYWDWYAGDKLEGDPDTTVVAGQFKPKYGTPRSTSSTVTAWNCSPLGQTINEGRSMLADPPYMDYRAIYSFAQTGSDIEFNNPLNFYLFTMKDEYLNRENFVEVEPVEFDGVNCKRYAYLGEDGGVLAYVIEGIGFDSRDRGDLLTPFTLPPDPDADYQEYWGLSHIIKDGRIIYRGMRFDAGRVLDVEGDVDGDGELSINDVVLLIDRLLSGGGTPRFCHTGDSNADGALTIEDVTLLIDRVLGIY